MNSLSGNLNKPQRHVAKLIVDGNLHELLENVIPKSYYSTAFDKSGNKLVAFAAKVAVKHGTTHDHGVHKAIFEYIVYNVPKDSDLTTCAVGRRGHCLAHAIAPHATQTSHINVIKNIINAKVGHGTFVKHAGKANANGRRAVNYAGTGAIREHYQRMDPATVTRAVKNATPDERAAIASLLAQMRGVRL